MKLKSSVLLAAVSLSACSSITIRPKGTAKLESQPNFEERQNYFFWGLSGIHTIDVKEVCHSKPVAQMQAQDTVVDSLLTAITLGIYMPRSARVWCAN